MLILSALSFGNVVPPTIRIKSYSRLSRDELFSILKLRQDVFVIEQNCPYEDIDMNDKNAYHLLCYMGDEFVGTARILKRNERLFIGRIASTKNKRNLGLGEMIINASINFIKKKFASKEIKIAAQEHLEKYYNRFNFIRSSDAYYDVGILHIDMIWREKNVRNCNN